MAKVKCQICGKKIDKDTAYHWIHETKTGNKYNKYACNKEEVENDKRDKELYKKTQYLTDDILGYAITNNNRNKKIRELQETGYSIEQIYRCLKHYKDEIIHFMSLKDSMTEYQKIQYIFTVIGNNIHDYSEIDANKNTWEQYVKKEEEVDVKIEEPVVDANYKVKKRKTLF